jgi:hypothetical protein
MSAVAIDTPRLSSVVMHEYESSTQYCRDVITVREGSAVDYAIGTVLGKTLTGGTGTATAGAGNTGNGTMGTVTVGGTAQVGTYTLNIVKAVSDAGDFNVVDPTGKVIGTGSVAVAFSGGGLSFTLADGSANFIVGDTFAIAVTGTVKYKRVEATATDGSAVACAIYISAKDGSYGTSTIAATTDTSVIALVRGNAIVGKAGLVFGASVNTDAELATAYSQLAAVGIICRDQIGSFPTIAA